MPKLTNKSCRSGLRPNLTHLHLTQRAFRIQEKHNRFINRHVYANHPLAWHRWIKFEIHSAEKLTSISLRVKKTNARSLQSVYIMESSMFLTCDVQIKSSS